MENEQTYYFLEIPLDDPDKRMLQLGRLGLQEELENGPSWLRAYLGQSINNLMGEEIFLVSDNKIWQWNEIVHQEYRSDPYATTILLNQLGIPEDAVIPTFRLTDESLAPVIDRDFYAIYPEAEAGEVINDLRKLGLLQPDSPGNTWIREEDIQNRPDELFYVRGNRLLHPDEYEGMDLSKTPVFMLDDLVKLQHAKDIAAVMDRDKSANNFIGIPFGRRTMEVCVAAVRSHPVNLKQAGSFHETDVLRNAYTDRVSPLFDIAKGIRPWVLNLETYYRFSALDERCVALPAYKDLPEYGVGLSEKEYGQIKTVSNDDRNHQHFKEIPYEERTLLLSMAALRAYGGNLCEVPENFRTAEVIMAALENNGLALEYVNPEKMTNRIIDTALLNSHGEAIKFIPEENRTREICMAAVELSGWMLHYVPDNLKDEEMCRNALKPSPLTGFTDYKVLGLIPYESVIMETLEACHRDNNAGFHLLHAISDKDLTDKIASYCVLWDKECTIHILDKGIFTEANEKAIENNWWNLDYLPEKHRTPDLCRHAGMQSVHKSYEGYTIMGYIPHAGVCLDILLGAKEMFNVSDMMKTIDPKLTESDVLLKMIAKEPSLADYIPVLKGKDDPYIQAILNFPEEYRTKELCIKAMENACLDKGRDRSLTGTILKAIPQTGVKIQTANVLWQQKIHSAIEFLNKISDTVKSGELLSGLGTQQQEDFLFVSNWPLTFIPEERMTQQLCNVAVLFEGDNIRSVPERLYDDEVITSMLCKYGYTLQYLPEEKKTYENCLIAVSADHRGLLAVPEKHLTEDLCRVAVQTGASFYEHFSNADSFDIFERIPYEHIVKEGIALLEPLLNKEKLTEVIAENAKNIKYIPDSYKTADFYNEAIKANGSALEHIPEGMKTKEMCLHAINFNPNAIGWIPENMRNSDVCLKSVMENPDNTTFVPENILKGKNIYTFYNRLEKFHIEPELSYHQIKDLFNGGSLIVPKITSGNQVLSNRIISYNKERNSIICTVKSEKIIPVIPKKEDKKNSIKL